MSEFLRPEFLVPAVAILVAAGAAWYMNVWRPRRRRATAAAGRVAAGAERDRDRDGSAEPVHTALDTAPAVTFDDIAALDEAIAELREFQEFLADPERFRTVGAQLPRGVLLYGPPGNGKTLLARALAGEAGVAFHHVSAAAFVEQFVGVGAARIRDLFEAAKRNAPAIVFIDELDAVGRRRTGGTAGDREFDHTLNQLLVELDGFDPASSVLIVGATNRPELLDTALTRPGRFDRRIPVDRPDVSGRLAILRLHAHRRPVSGKVDWARIAEQTAGLSGAELAGIVNEASLLAARRHHGRVSSDDVDEAIARVLSGPRSARPMTDEVKRLIAYHEAGHAVLSVLLRGITPPPRISLVARGGALSRSPWAPSRDQGVATKRELMAQLMVLMGGRAAERNVFGEPSTRAEDDLEDAADLGRHMVERWGMTGRLELAGRIWAEPGELKDAEGVRRLLSRAEQAARSILRDHERELERVATALIERETLLVGEVTDLAGAPPLPRPEAAEPTELHA